jgi:hypothetical protein
MNDVKLPAAIAEKYELKVPLPANPCYFNGLGHVNFNELTEEQAAWLVKHKSPHITLKATKKVVAPAESVDETKKK